MQRKVKKGWLRHGYWVLNQIAIVNSFVITFFYWTMLHDPGINQFSRVPIAYLSAINVMFARVYVWHTPHNKWLIFHLYFTCERATAERDKIDAINLMVYVFNSVIMFIDLCVVTHPISMSHTYWTMGIGVIYTIFTIFYFIGGGTSR